MPNPLTGQEQSTKAASAAGSSTGTAKRVLACVLCQQRKVKCDRKFPCANCIRLRAQCIPADMVKRPRKRRFPERELLDRLRRYEDLLRQNNVPFEPLHGDRGGDKGQRESSVAMHEGDHEHSGATETEVSSPSTTTKAERKYEAKNLLQALTLEFRDDDTDSNSSQDEVHDEIAKVWDQTYRGSGNLLLGASTMSTDNSQLHPETAQIFRLWQIYLEHVDPLLKVTHNPSLQGRIVEAASNLVGIDSNLEALMFSIYCVAVESLRNDDCQTMFGSSKADLLTRYQFGCQQALSNCGFLQTSSHECLTALFLYLVAAGPSTDPRALCAMLGVAVRNCQRIGIHSEAVNTKFDALEGEMRRRLWWALILFDSRISEMAKNKISTLAPTWDCQIPRNVNDTELRPGMREPPAVQSDSTEALFVVVRSKLGDFIRHASFHLEFTNPALKSVVNDMDRSGSGSGSDTEELTALDAAIEEKHLSHCDVDNPAHFMTVWFAREYLARYRLINHYATYSSLPANQKEAHRHAAISNAFKMLECDTKIMSSPLTKGYSWFTCFQFPALAYFHVMQDLRKDPYGEHSDLAWSIVNENFAARFTTQADIDSPLLSVLIEVVEGAWSAREEAATDAEMLGAPPRIVAEIQAKQARSKTKSQPSTDPDAPNITTMDWSSTQFPMAMTLGFDAGDPMYYMSGHVPFGGVRQGPFSYMPGDVPFTAGLNRFHHNVINWQSGQGGQPQGW